MPPRLRAGHGYAWVFFALALDPRHGHWPRLGVLGAVARVLLGAVFLSALSLPIALLVKSRDRFMGAGQTITMPLFVASNAIYPIAIMPRRPRWVARLHARTYVVNLLRAFPVTGSAAGVPTALAILAGALVVAQILSARSDASVVV